MVKAIILFIIFLIMIAMTWLFIGSSFISGDREREKMWDDYNKRNNNGK